jgi:hypothetical protein
VPKSSGPRNKRQRQREGRFVSVATVVEYDAQVLNMLIADGKLTEAQCFDRVAIDRAISMYLAEAATRCAH